MFACGFALFLFSTSVLSPNFCFPQTSTSSVRQACGTTQGPFLITIFAMTDPRETWRRLQISLQQRGGQGFGGGFPGGNPRGGAAAIGGLVLLGVGGVLISNSLFNGKLTSGNS